VTSTYDTEAILVLVCHTYIPRARKNSTSLANIEVAFADVADVIERRFESHIINAQLAKIMLHPPPLLRVICSKGRLRLLFEHVPMISHDTSISG
jgi:hypothetical protein